MRDGALAETELLRCKADSDSPQKPVKESQLSGLCTSTTRRGSKYRAGFDRINERLGHGRKAQSLLEGLWRAGKQIKLFCSSLRSIERQATSLSWPA
jgi:hypothetical protein